MPLGLHKPGQGYWVRVMTASMCAVVILAASAWLWRQLQAVSLTGSEWSLTLVSATGSAQVGSAVELVRRPVTPDAEPIRIGTAVISKLVGTSPAATTIQVSDVSLVDGELISNNVRVVATDPAFTGTVSLYKAVPLFERIYLQAGGVGLLLIVGAGFVYWLVGVKPATSEFLIATDGEMKKVNWSTRKAIIDSTWVVIAWSVILAATLSIIDLGFAKIFKLIGVLD